MLKDHEKFIAFCLLGGALTAFGVLIYLHPLRDSSANSGVLQILNMIIGALIGGFGAAVSQLLKASTDSVTVANKPSEPIPTTESPAPLAAEEPSVEELPDYAR
jgi:hypothetical protein